MNKIKKIFYKFKDKLILNIPFLREISILNIYKKFKLKFVLYIKIFIVFCLYFILLAISCYFIEIILPEVIIPEINEPKVHLPEVIISEINEPKVHLPENTKINTTLNTNFFSKEEIYEENEREKQREEAELYKRQREEAELYKRQQQFKFFLKEQADAKEKSILMEKPLNDTIIQEAYSQVHNDNRISFSKTMHDLQIDFICNVTGEERTAVIQEALEGVSNLNEFSQKLDQMALISALDFAEHCKGTKNENDAQIILSDLGTAFRAKEDIYWAEVKLFTTENPDDIGIVLDAKNSVEIDVIEIYKQSLEVVKKIKKIKK